MQIKKMTAIALVSVMTATALPVAATVMGNPSRSEVTVSASDDKDSGKDAKKDKKKKDKKKKKEKEVKSPEEILAAIKALEWKKPATSGLEVDAYYKEADEFFAAVKSIDEKVSLFKVCKVELPDTVLIVPVDIRTGQVRRKNEAFAQVAESALFATDLTLMTTSLAAGAVAHAIQIGQDAIPFVGNAERKAANVQIAKAVKVFPMLKSLIDSQNGMLKRYFKQNANVETTDSVSDAMAVGAVDFSELESLGRDLTPEELEAQIAVEAEEI